MTNDMAPKILRPGSTKICLVEYYVLPKETLIFIATPDKDGPLIERRNLSADALRSLSNQIVKDFSANNINPAYPEWSTGLEYLKPLGDDLILSIMDYLASVDIIYIVPHSDLFYFPFHAFKVESERYLIEEKPVAYAPSATLLENARLLRHTVKATTFLGLGVGKKADPTTRKEDFEQEIKTLADFPFWARSEILLGLQASKAEFVKRAGQFDVAHFACHGYFNRDDPLGSGLLLSDGTQLPEQLETIGTSGRHTDYLLSAREIASLPIKATLVYFSACVSGRHDIQPGDEIMGLTRSLIRAEVASAVVSLWPVAASKPTRLLMQRFYENWLGQGLSKVQAFQSAQLETMRSFPHPYHWAPFVLIGDWS